MLPKKLEIYKYHTQCKNRSKRRQSPQKSSKNMLSHSMDYVKSTYVERDSSFLSLQKKTSQSGFYSRP